MRASHREMHKALLRMLLRKRSAEKSLYAATYGGKASSALMRDAARVERMLETELVPEGETTPISDLADQLEAVARAEMRTVEIDDEGCASGIQEHVNTVFGLHCKRASQDLRMYLVMAEEVHCHILAMKLMHELGAEFGT